MVKDFSHVIKNLPQKPGVYRFYSLDEELLYIGKAKNLKNRVSSYFQAGRGHNQRISLMVSQVDRIEYTTVSTERESLLLEANLIHNLQPRYNVLLKDDRSYSYVKITNEKNPRIYITRKKSDSKARYYGPYTSNYNIKEVLRSLRIIFPFCQKPKKDGLACEYVSIKQCDGICCGQETTEHYNQKIKHIENILKGKTGQAEEYLNKKIKQAITDSNFALASFWRDRLQLLKDTLSQSINKQIVVLPKTDDLDIITLIQENNDDGLQIGSVFVQNIRDGKLINVQNYLLSGSSDNKNDFLERFIKSYYTYKNEDVPVLVQKYNT